MMDRYRTKMRHGEVDPVVDLLCLLCCIMTLGIVALPLMSLLGLIR